MGMPLTKVTGRRAEGGEGDARLLFVRGAEYSSPGLVPGLVNVRPDDESGYERVRTDLRRARLSRRNLQGRDLRRAILREANLAGASLAGADLRDADLRGADLFECDLSFADIRGALVDTTRIVEIRLPRVLDPALVNQIRAFDFEWSVVRRVRPVRPGVERPCPYKSSSLRPLLFVWGSATWHGGEGWSRPSVLWPLERIIAGVLDSLNCRHDLGRTSTRTS
jgi:hypothetical protein